MPCMPLFCSLPLFDIVCDLIQNRCMTTYKLFVTHNNCMDIQYIPSHLEGNSPLNFLHLLSKCSHCTYIANSFFCNLKFFSKIKTTLPINFTCSIVTKFQVLALCNKTINFSGLFLNFFSRYQLQLNGGQFNPFTSKISSVILLTICHTINIMLVQRIWYWIN